MECPHCGGWVESCSTALTRRRRAAGLCTQCGAKSERFSYCLKCRLKKNELERRRYQLKESKGRVGLGRMKSRAAGCVERGKFIESVGVF